MDSYLERIEPNHCYTVKELAHVWNLSAETVRRMVDEEPGVLVFETKRKARGRRRYRSIRIPGWLASRLEERSKVS